MVLRHLKDKATGTLQFVSKCCIGMTLSEINIFF